MHGVWRAKPSGENNLYKYTLPVARYQSEGLPARDIWSLGVMVQVSGQMGELLGRRRRRRRSRRPAGGLRPRDPPRAPPPPPPVPPPPASPQKRFSILPGYQES